MNTNTKYSSQLAMFGICKSQQVLCNVCYLQKAKVSKRDQKPTFQYPFHFQSSGPIKMLLITFQRKCGIPCKTHVERWNVSHHEWPGKNLSYVVTVRVRCMISLYFLNANMCRKISASVSFALAVGVWHFLIYFNI